MGNTVVKKTLKIIGWTLLAIVLLIGVLLFCAVKFIDSDKLSKMIENVANEYIEGEVKLGDIELSLKPGFHILSVEIDNLTVISHAFDSLSSSERGKLPDYADSLLSINHLSGSLDLKRLIFNKEISLHDVNLHGLGVNLIIAHNGKANYNFLKSSSDSVKEKKRKNPMGFRINHFTLNDPREIHFYNAADSTSASVVLLTDAAIDGEEQPTYKLKINGNISSPKASLVTDLNQITFGLNGKIFWDPNNPGCVVMDQMEVRGAFITALITGEIDLSKSPIIKRLTMQLNPIAITDLITLLPDSIRNRYRLSDSNFSSDAAIRCQLELKEPMNLTTDTLPTARLDISVAPSYLRYEESLLSELALDLTVNTFRNLPDSTLLDLKKVTLVAPGTDFQAFAKLTTPISDPTLNLDAVGKIDIKDLPSILLENIPGYLSGKITTDLKAKVSLSMLRPERIHDIEANGLLMARNLYFLAADTSKLVEVGNLKIDFNADERPDGTKKLITKLDIDTTTVLVSGIDLAFGSVSLNAETEKLSIYRKELKSDTAGISTINGNLKVGRFNITTITDSAGAKINDINGPFKIQNAIKNTFSPEITTTLKIGKVSAGTKTDRVLLANTNVRASMFKPSKKAKTNVGKTKKKGKTSSRRLNYISPAAVHAYVYKKRRHRKHTRRVYVAAGADNNEILVWHLTDQFRRFLNEWKLNGSVNTYQARLAIPDFKLKNQISKISLNFNNDTIDIAEISMLAGNSDLKMTGLITNVSRSLSAVPNSILKGNFSLLFDTIDVNELSATLFSASSHHGKKSMPDHKEESEKKKMKSLLLPTNIDGNLRIKAQKVLYSDFSLTDMFGDVLLYGGGLNIHNLNACSDVGNLSFSALYSAPERNDMNLGFGLVLKDFDIAKFVKLVPAIDSITPLLHDFSGMIGAEIAATCRINSDMDIVLPSLNAAMRINGDNLAFIDPKKYRTLGKWLGFKNKADNTIHTLTVEMTVEDGVLRVYPFVFNIDRYRLGVYGSNDIAMNFNYHLSVLKSPIPFKFGITISGDPKKYKVRFGGPKFNENSIVESTDMVNSVRINLLDQIEGIFRRGVKNSHFAKLNLPRQQGDWDYNLDELSAADSLQLIKEGVLEPSDTTKIAPQSEKHEKKKKRKRFWIF